MRPDVFIEEVIEKCDVLKRAGLWPSDTILRPRLWLQNFDGSDRFIAALLLDKFTFYNIALTEALLTASYNSIADGMEKGPSAPGREILVGSLASAALTPVRGEEPNPTDSGNTMCRMARQVLRVPETQIVEVDVALAHAYRGNTVVFIDDFVGSGDQFLKTWRRTYPNSGSFASAHAKTGFVAIYITLVSTAVGLREIHKIVPEVAVCVCHTIESESTFHGMADGNQTLQDDVAAFLRKYSPRLTPVQPYIANNPKYLMYGYKELGLLFGFQHSIPDATLPLFWSPGTNNWEPLIERR